MSAEALAPAGFDVWPASQVHVEWGVTGAGHAASRGVAAVVVDVLSFSTASFSTAICMAVARDVPCLVHSEAEIADLGGREALAERLGARPLTGRRRVEPGALSLSPSSLLHAEAGQRVLFTSLNGAAVTAASAPAPALMIAGLRNARAVVRAILKLLARRDDVTRVTVVPCGERWGSVEPRVAGTRFAIEDWLGQHCCAGVSARPGYGCRPRPRWPPAPGPDPRSRGTGPTIEVVRSSR